MNENLDLTEILKDCPSGVKFYSPICGKITFNRINEKSTRRPIETDMYIFTTDGKYNLNGECMIFPSKDQRDWSKWHRPFVDGDVVMYDDDQFAIFKEYIKHPETERLIRYYLYYDAENDDLDTEGGQAYVKRLATEEEKQKLFKAIQENGYRWNAETKTLEKLEDMEDKGNISNWYHTFNELYEYRLLYNASMFNELAKQGLYDVHKSKKHSDGTIPFGDENWFIVQAELSTGQISNHYEMKDWDLFKIPEKEKANPYDGHTPKDVAKRLRDFLTLEKSIVPKFKVGDRIRYAGEDFPIKIIDIKNNQYHIECFCDKYNDYKNGIIPVSEQNNYMLIPKFNPKTLQPFDRVLISCNDEWFCDFFSHYDNAVVKFNCICTGGCPYDYCIPYNNDTKHLIGKSIEDTPEFYKYWEE